MREIKFRGFYHFKKNALYPEVKKWVYGSLEIRKDGSYWILDKEDESYRYKVDPKSVGQYTGLKDRNGIEIYEGDIVKVHDNDAWINPKKPENMGVVEYKDGCYYVAKTYIEYNVGCWMYATEVVGNIYENKELIK